MGFRLPATPRQPPRSEAALGQGSRRDSQAPALCESPGERLTGDGNDLLSLESDLLKLERFTDAEREFTEAGEVWERFAKWVGLIKAEREFCEVGEGWETIY